MMRSRGTIAASSSTAGHSNAALEKIDRHVVCPICCLTVAHGDKKIVIKQRRHHVDCLKYLDHTRYSNTDLMNELEAEAIRLYQNLKYLDTESFEALAFLRTEVLIPANRMIEVSIKRSLAV